MTPTDLIPIICRTWHIRPEEMTSGQSYYAHARYMYWYFMSLLGVDMNDMRKFDRRSYTRDQVKYGINKHHDRLRDPGYKNLYNEVKTELFKQLAA